MRLERLAEATPSLIFQSLNCYVALDFILRRWESEGDLMRFLFLGRSLWWPT